MNKEIPPNDDDCFYHHSWRNNVGTRLNCVWNTLVFSYLAFHSVWRCLRCCPFAGDEN